MNSDEIVIQTMNGGKYLKIIRAGNIFYLDPKKYDISTLMMLLDITKLNTLENEFAKNKEDGDDGLKKNVFIELMMKQVMSEFENNKLNLIYGLYKLFSEIDFNGDGTMQWKEFTQFIIDKVMGENNSGEDGEDVGEGKDNNEKQYLKYKRYNISNIQDTKIHETDIVDTAYLPKINQLYAVEYKSTNLHIYNPIKGTNYTVDIEQILKTLEEKKVKRKAESENKLKIGNKKRQPVSKPSMTFSILSLCAVPHYNILALCTTQKKILFFEFAVEKGKEELKFEISTPTLQKKVWFLPDHNAWLSSGSKRDDDPNGYYYLNELDVEFDYKSQRIEVLSNNTVYRSSISKHTKDILDVCEIKKPMLVLTACMDKFIRLINLNEATIVMTWKKYHSSSIRCLDFNPYVGAGLIISVGFEYYINLWSTEVSIDEDASFKGRLEGHYSPVIMCKFICNSPMCVSVDEEGNIRIWDTRQFLCLQLIPQTNINFKGSKLLLIPKLNKFIFYGNKILFYDTKYQDTENLTKNLKEEENYPIKVLFNTYYMNFYVTTYKDIRIYSSNKGELLQVFKNLRSNVISDSDIRIRHFAFENRFRKFYIGYNNGAIQQFNAGNGSLIKRIGEHEEEKDGITIVKHDHCGDINFLFFHIYEDKEKNQEILVSTSTDSVINVYDENDPEESEKFRSLRGGHKIGERNNQILCMDFSKNLNLMATGSTDSLITVWDFELSKIDDICYFKKGPNESSKDVLTVKFMDPYPALYASYSDGSIYVWGVKPVILKYRYECIIRIKNYHWNGLRYEFCNINSTLFVHKEMKEIEKQPAKNPMKLKKRKKKIKQEVIPTSVVRNSMKNEYKDLEMSDKINLIKLNPKKSKNLDIIPKFTEKEEIEPVDNLGDQEYEKSDTEYDVIDYDDSNEKSYIIYGDNKGFIKILNIRNVFIKLDINKTSNVSIKSNYNIIKKDDINVELLLTQYLQRERPELDEYTNIYKNLLVREFQAHDDAITDLSEIEEPSSFVSCSKDKKFKIWNYNCELLGEVLVLPSLNHKPIETEWKFTIDWEKLNYKELKEVMKIYDTLTNSEIMFLDQEAIIKETSRNVDEYKKVTNKNDLFKRRRHKPLEEKKMTENKNNDGNEDDDIRLEDQILQEHREKVKKLVSPTPIDMGIYEMTKNLMDIAMKKDTKDYFSLITKEKAQITQRTKKIQEKSIKRKKQQTKVVDDKYFLFSEKLFKSNSSISAIDQMPLLPFIKDQKNDNIKFKKGETERILANEFYQNCYNSSIKISNVSSSLDNNDVIQNNYKRLWKSVNEYKSKLIANEEKNN